MTMRRRDVVSLEEPGKYHCNARCVRRAFLCGYDELSGKSYEHRRQWIKGRVKFLTRHFAVKALSVSVMHNHVHLVVLVNPQIARAWSDREVARRWCAVFGTKGDKDESARQLREQVLLGDPQRLSEYRMRLGDLSWFMRCVSEDIARRANSEDGCTGRFWEGRFKCQGLIGAAAVLACMAYVDLNPVRANIAKGLEDSRFTSAYDRLHALRAQERLAALGPEPVPDRAQQVLIERERRQARRADWLVCLDGPDSPFTAMDTLTYLNLVECTGRMIRADKPGALPADLADLVERLGLDARAWAANVAAYRSLFFRVAGRIEDLAGLARQRGRRWFRGRSGSLRLYKSQCLAG